MPASAPVLSIESRDNPLIVRLRKLARDPAAYRKQGQLWLQGEHLCAALRQRGLRPLQGIISVDAWQRPAWRALACWALQVVQVPSRLFEEFSALPSSGPSDGQLGFVMKLPEVAPITCDVNSMVLDRLQDAGNVGSILRSAAAFGVTQVLALKGTAAFWSPKVLRAGMGAHFGLRLIEGLQIDDLLASPLARLPWVGTALSAELTLHQAVLPSPCAWIVGHEGQGVDATLLARCAQVVRIPQPGGEESLNVAAAAAVCLYEAMRQNAGSSSRA